MQLTKQGKCNFLQYGNKFGIFCFSYTPTDSGVTAEPPPSSTEKFLRTGITEKETPRPSPVAIISGSSGTGCNFHCLEISSASSWAVVMCFNGGMIMPHTNDLSGKDSPLPRFCQRSSKGGPEHRPLPYV